MNWLWYTFSLSLSRAPDRERNFNSRSCSRWRIPVHKTTWVSSSLGLFIRNTPFFDTNMLLRLSWQLLKMVVCIWDGDTALKEHVAAIFTFFRFFSTHFIRYSSSLENGKRQKLDTCIPVLLWTQIPAHGQVHEANEICISSERGETERERYEKEKGGQRGFSFRRGERSHYDSNMWPFSLWLVVNSEVNWVEKSDVILDFRNVSNKTKNELCSADVHHLF